MIDGTRTVDLKDKIIHSAICATTFSLQHAKYFLESNKSVEVVVVVVFAVFAVVRAQMAE